MAGFNFIDSIELSLNNFCNLQCIGCSSLCSDHQLACELNFKKVIKVIEGLSPERIVLCGNNGEPTEHTKFYEILVELSNVFKESQIHVSTNGELIKEIFNNKDLSALNNNILFEISIDGIEEENHRLTRQNGNLDRVYESIEFLIECDLDFQLVYTRHELNSKNSEKAHDYLLKRFEVEVLFRDTTIVSKNIRPPELISNNGDVSVLYGDKTKLSKVSSPNFKNVYIDNNGDCYPCVSFSKYNSKLNPVNIYKHKKSGTFLKEFLVFQREFCNKYQAHGDRRQCHVNCDVYCNSFKYDKIEDIRKLND